MVWKVATTSGEADRMLVLEMGARKEQKLRTETITIFFLLVNFE